MSAAGGPAPVVCAGPGIRRRLRHAVLLPVPLPGLPASSSAIPTPAGISATVKPSWPPAPCRAPTPIRSPAPANPGSPGNGSTDVAAGAHPPQPGSRTASLFSTLLRSRAGVWLWFRLHWALGGNFLVACAMAPLLLSTCNIHWLARPHVLSWIFLLLGDVSARAASASVVGLVTALWANIHASFFFAPLIALLFALELTGWYPVEGAQSGWRLRARSAAEPLWAAALRPRLPLPHRYANCSRGSANFNPSISIARAPGRYRHGDPRR